MVRDRQDGWAIMAIRPGASRTHFIRVRDPRFLAGVVAAVVVVAGGAAVAGHWWASRQARARVAALEARLAEAATQTARIRDLAERLDKAESSYAQLRQLVGGEVTGSAREVRLPEPATTTSVNKGIAPTDDSATLLPASWPVARRGFVSRSFEPQSGSALGEHRGVDIALPSGSYVRAAGGGIVEEAGDDPVYGLFVRVAHSQGITTLYGHNSWLFVAEGDSVEQNEVLALSGNTGQSSAPHLHFEVRRNGEAIDPTVFISGF